MKTEIINRLKRPTDRLLISAVCLLVTAQNVLAVQPPATINPDAPPPEVFATAGAAYDEGDLTRSIALYRELVNDGYQNAEIYFNLGNALFRQGQTGAAILNFKRALLRDPMDGDTSANLRFALEHAGALVPHQTLLQKMLQKASLQQWMLFASILWWLLAALLIVLILLPNQRQLLTRVSIVAAACLLVCALGAWNGSQQLRHPEAVILKGGQHALSAPLAGSTVLFDLPEGSIARILERSGQWSRIKTGGQAGWIPDSICQRVTSDKM